MRRETGTMDNGIFKQTVTNTVCYRIIQTFLHCLCQRSFATYTLSILKIYNPISISLPGSYFWTIIVSLIFRCHYVFVHTLFNLRLQKASHLCKIWHKEGCCSIIFYKMLWKQFDPSIITVKDYSFPSCFCLPNQIVVQQSWRV